MIDFKEVKEASILLVNINGKVVFQKTNSFGLVNISAQKFPKGVYLLLVKDKNSLLFNQKIIID